MARVIVSGLINIETTLRIDSFPLAYNPVNYPFGGVASTVSGVGLNVARALQVLGHDVTLTSMLGRDAAATLVLKQLSDWGLSQAGIALTLDATPQSVIIYDREGRRQIHVDLKSVQETPYPLEACPVNWPAFDLAVLCNINFSRGLIPHARSSGLPIATDVHTIGDLDDAYNRDFMEAADILFLSHEHLPGEPSAVAENLSTRYGCRTVVVSMGAAGALIRHAGELPVQVPARASRPIVSTIGAGDALFSGFLHGILSGRKPVDALRAATVFASWKIGAASASSGFLTAPELDILCDTLIA